MYFQGNKTMSQIFAESLVNVPIENRENAIRLVFEQDKRKNTLVTPPLAPMDKLILAAAERGDLDALQVLSGRGSENTLNLALGLAAEFGHLDTVKFLLNVGANVNAQDGEAIKLAAVNGHQEVVRYLLFSGADPDAGSGEPLVNASEYGRGEIVKLLLEYGADPTLEDYYAAREAKDTDTVIQFIIAGVSPDIIGSIALERRKEDLRLLQKAKNKGS